MDDFSGLKITGVSKRFGQFQALEDVGFELRPHEVLGLIGPNGAGKTTLLECIPGIQPCDAGTLYMGGRAGIRSPITVVLPARRNRTVVIAVGSVGFVLLLDAAVPKLDDAAQARVK